MTRTSVVLLIDQIKEASTLALSYVEGFSKVEFLADVKTQQAVTMNLIIIGEASSRILTKYPEFARCNKDLPWQEMKGLRNRIAHGYFEINQETVWDAVILNVPDLLKSLSVVELSSDFQELRSAFNRLNAEQ
jgi:uncharacterized protein with HEPN domain